MQRAVSGSSRRKLESMLGANSASTQASLRRVLILLPPSEGKTRPPRGAPLDLATLSFRGLNPTRMRILAALMDLCTTDRATAAAALGLGPSQSNEVTLNTLLTSSPSAPAIRIYSGVLFDALDYASLSTQAKRRAQASVAISSGLWGLVRPKDRIPSYRLSGGVSLPGIGTLASAWREPVGQQIAESTGLIIDLRSSTYAALGAVPANARHRSVSVRVLQERDGRRTTVSHMNKATKGRILRAALESDAAPASSTDLVDALHDWGFTAELDGTSIDVVISEL